MDYQLKMRMEMNMQCRFCHHPIDQMAEEIVRYSARSYAHQKCWLELTLRELKNRRLLNYALLAEHVNE